MNGTKLLLEHGVEGSSKDMFELSRTILEAKVGADSPSPKLAMNLFRLINSKYERIDTAEIDKSLGDVTKLSFYGDINDSIKAIKKYLDGFKIKSKHFTIIESNLKFLKANKQRFREAYKDKNSFLMYIYTAAVINLMDTINIMISAIMRNLSEAVNIDKYIDSVDSYKMRFAQGRTIFVDNAGDLSKMMSAKISLVEGQNMFSDYQENIIESSLNFYLEVLQLGLAKTLFVLLGFLRYTIYGFFYIKETIVFKLDRLRKFLTYIDTNESQEAEKLTKELDSESRQAAMRTIEGDAAAQKDIAGEKIQANALL